MTESEECIFDCQRWNFDMKGWRKTEQGKETIKEKSSWRERLAQNQAA